MYMRMYGASKISSFKLGLRLINHKTCRVSWNFALVTQRDTNTHTTYTFFEKVCHNILNQINHFAWIYEVCSLNIFSWAKVNHLRQPDFFGSAIWLWQRQLWDILRIQLHLPDVNHCVLLIFDPKIACNLVSTLGPWLRLIT